MMQHCRSLPDLAFDVGIREDGGTREDAGCKRRYKLYKVWGLVNAKNNVYSIFNSDFLNPWLI